MKRILLVHNIATALHEIQNMLVDNGCAVTAVTTVNEALACLKEHPAAYCLVCCKMLLPYRDGFDLHHAVRADPMTASLPFVMLVEPANEWNSYQAWHAKRPRYEFLKGDRRDISVVWIEAPPSTGRLLSEDILEAIQVAVAPSE